MNTILVCDDERDIVSALRIYLEAEGYGVLTAYDGHEALAVLGQEDVQLVLLDIMMPGLDGLQTLKLLREELNLPVILLTAKSEDIDKIVGLNLGADDYITKPFNPSELLARVRSQLRRYLQLGSGAVKPTVLSVGGITLDTAARTVILDGERVELTPREYDILCLLMQNAGKVFSPREIYRRVWRENPIGAEKTVAVHIRHLREKLEIDPAEPRLLKVVWGQGYRMEGGKK